MKRKNNNEVNYPEKIFLEKYEQNSIIKQVI